MSRARVALPRCAHHAHGVRGQIALFMPRLTPDRRFEANAARRASLASAGGAPPSQRLACRSQGRVIMIQALVIKTR